MARHSSKRAGANARLTVSGLAEAVRVLCAYDQDLAVAVNRHGLPPLWDREPGFETLARIILEQQVSLASADAAYERLRRGVPRFSASTVARRAPEELRAMGLTRQKASYISGLARSVAGGDVDLDTVTLEDDDAARTTLMSIRGVGRWSADIYLLMALGRPDVWPRGDLALEAAMARVKGLSARPDAKVAAAIAEAWSPWRSVAARILWHTYLSERAS